MVIQSPHSIKRLSRINAQSQGFTLIELMITVAIIGILAAIAYPNYQRYVIKTKRVDMMSEMQQLATRVESSKINYRRYDKIPLAELYSSAPIAGSMNFPSSGTALYSVTITPKNSANTHLNGKEWQIIATPKIGTQMAGDGTLTLDSQGIKCRAALCGSGNEWN